MSYAVDCTGGRSFGEPQDIRKSRIACNIASCYRKPAVHDNAYAVDFKGARSFGGGQVALCTLLVCENLSGRELGN